MSLQYVETRMGRALVTSAERRHGRIRKHRAPERVHLPPPLKKYRLCHKLAILAAVDDGTLSQEGALSLYGLTAERLRGWRQAMPASEGAQR